MNQQQFVKWVAGLKLRPHQAKMVAIVAAVRGIEAGVECGRGFQAMNRQGEPVQLSIFGEGGS